MEPQQVQQVPHAFELQHYAYQLKIGTAQNSLLLQIQVMLVIIVFLLAALLVLTAVKR